MLPQGYTSVSDSCSEGEAWERHLDAFYTPEERYQQARSEKRWETNTKRDARRKQEPSALFGQSGVKPPLPPLETRNKFGTLEEVKSPVSYADYVKRAPSRPLRREFPPLRVEANPFSPVPGSKKALVSKKP